MVVVCQQNLTWDAIALSVFDDEFKFVQLIEANPEYSDVVTFDGGERVFVSDDIFRAIEREKSAFGGDIIKAPWE